VPDLLIRDLDPEAHRELKRRAERAGQSLQSYVARLLQSHVSRPTVEDWLERLDDIEPVPGASGSEAVAGARAELP
jgi:hypothetical protein